jgi:hypothetical protein
MSRFYPILGSFQVILDGEKGLGLEGDAPESLPFTDDINDSLIPVGLEITDLQAANFGLSISQSLFLAKPRPEGLLRYFSKSRALCRSPKATAVFMRQGLYFEV